MTYAATKKQQGYYKHLTGEWLPRNCSKSRASQLIDKALRGEIKKKQDEVKVGRQAVFFMGQYMPEQIVVEKNFYPVPHPRFESFEDAESWARANFPGARIEVDRAHVRQVCTD